MDEQKTPAISVTLFCVYAQADEKHWQNLKKHLSALSQQGLITILDDRQILPGTNRKQALDDYLKTASVILLLISSDFINSGYCSRVEMQHALARHEEGNARIIPVLLRSVYWENTPFSSIQPLPSNRQPVAAWRDKDAAFVDITEGIRRAIEGFSPTMPGSSVNWDRQRHASQHKTYETIARRDYLKHLETRYTFLTLPTGPAEGLALQAVFQPLKLRPDPVAAEDRQREARRHLLGETVSVEHEPEMIAQNGEDALAKSPQNRIIVLGGPGTGKTTLLQSLISERTQQALIDPTILLPIYLSLPDLARRDVTLPEYLLRLGREAGLPDTSLNLFWKSIEEGTAFVCLDSLDEVTPGERPAMIRLINELATRSGNTWVVGSRFTDYKGGQFLRGRFTEWELLPLDHPLREQLAQRLLPELSQLLLREKRENEADPVTFVQVLEHHAQASAWGENPLLFSLAATLFVRTATLPISLIVLYQQVIDAILETREPDPTRRRLLRHIVAELALDLYRTKGRIFTRDDILALLPAIRRKQDENWSTEEMVTRIITSGMLDIVAQETYGFRHQTFQEYLTAVALARQLASRDHMVREEGWSFAWSKRTYSRWSEILRLMVGVLTQNHYEIGIQQCRRWLTALTQQRAEPRGDPGFQGLKLAMVSLPELSGMRTDNQKAYKREEIEEEVVSLWLGTLFVVEAEESWRMQQLAQYLKYVSPPVAKGVVAKLLATFHKKEERTQIIALQTLQYLEDYVPLELIFTLLSDPDYNVRYTAVSNLRARGERVPVAALLEAILHGKYFSTCKDLGMILGQRGREDVLISQLMALLRSDNWYARASATIALAQLGESVSAEPFLADLEDQDKEKREDAASVLECLAEAGVDVPCEPLFTAIGNAWSSTDSLARGLGSLGSVPLERLITLLNEKNLHVRLAGLKALQKRVSSSLKGDTFTRIGASPHNAENTFPYGNVGGSEIFSTQILVELALKMLQDDDMGLRFEAAKLLVELSEHCQIPMEPLLAAMTDDRDHVRQHMGDYVRKSILRVLGNNHTCVPEELLLKALCDDAEEVRQEAADALIKSGISLSEELLQTHIQHHLTGMRVTAFNVLERLNKDIPPEIVDTLFNNENVHARILAAKIRISSITEEKLTIPTIHLDDEVELERLLIELQDKDTETRIYARLRLIPEVGNNWVVLPLKSIESEIVELVLNKEKTQQLFSAIQEQSTIPTIHLDDTDALEQILTELQDGDAWTRIHAVLRLAFLGIRNQVSAELVVEASFNNKNVHFRVLAAKIRISSITEEQLAIPAIHLDDDVVEERLLIRLQDEDVWARISFASMLASQGVSDKIPVELVLTALVHKDLYVRWRAVEVAMCMGHRVLLEPLLVALDDKEVYSHTKQTVVHFVEERLVEERLSEEALLAALRSSHLPLQRAAAHVLGKQKVQHAIPFLIALLKDYEEENWEVAVDAAWALKELQVPIEPMIALLTKSLVKDLYTYRSEDAAQALVFLRVYEPVIQALSHIKIFNGFSIYMNGPRVRCEAIHALGQLQDQAIRELIVAALGDSEEKVRQSALQVLHQRHPEMLLSILPEAVAILQGHASGNILGSMLQGITAETIGNLGYTSPPLIEKLLTLLDWPYWEVRMKAAQSLGKLRCNIPDPGIHRLFELRHDPRQPQTVRLAADEALGSILSREMGIEDD